MEREKEMEIFNYEQIKPSMFYKIDDVAFESELKEKLMEIMSKYSSDLDKPKAKVKVFAIDIHKQCKSVIYCEGYKETLVNAFLYISEKCYNEAPKRIEKVGNSYKVWVYMEDEFPKTIPFKNHKKYTFLNPDLIMDGKS